MKAFTTGPFTGKHFAVIIVAFFAVVVSVNVYMARAASSTFGGVVVENSYVASQNFNAWLAEADGKAVGFAMVDAEEGCVFAAFVLPEWEGRGLGRRLMAEAEASLFRRHETIWLETDGRSRASGFYAHLGWKPTATDGNGDVRFEKKRPRPALSLSGPGEEPF